MNPNIFGKPIKRWGSFFTPTYRSVDESASLGEAISVVLQKSLPVAYTTDGQEIPKNISRASGHALVAKAVAMLKESINDARGMAAL